MGTEYTFEIRRGVRFHDGSLVTAQDVVYSLQRVFDLPEEDTGLARQYLCHILGTDDYVTGKAPAVRGLEVLSPDTVRIRLSKPLASFLAVGWAGYGMLVEYRSGYLDKLRATPIARTSILAGEMVPLFFEAAIMAGVLLGVSLLLGATLATGVGGWE